MFTGCIKKPYQYPNYDVIKPNSKFSAKRNNIQKQLTTHLGKPYVWAEEGPHAFDCSGLTYNIYCSMDIDIPRVAREQAKVGKKIDFNDLMYGDLIFFGPPHRKWKPINHVGIYLQDGNFAHASSDARVVTITNFKEEPIYKKRIRVCRRYINKNENKFYLQEHAELKPFSVTSTYFTTPWQQGMPLPKKAVPQRF
jgi:hypothetical protein